MFYQVNLTRGRFFKWNWLRNRLQGTGFKKIATSLKKTEKNTASTSTAINLLLFYIQNSLDTNGKNGQKRGKHSIFVFLTFLKTIFQVHL